MNLKKSLLVIILFITFFSYGNDKLLTITEETGTNGVCNIKNLSELDKSILNKMCSFESMYKVGISEKKSRIY